MVTLLAFMVAIGILVTFHELGHYAVAKLFGVRVLRFSIGFGKPLLSWRMFDTEWVLCPVLLGGYVRMQDEREGSIDPAERHRSFNVQPVLKRMAIVFAGPLANLLLAVLLYWVVIAHGVLEVRPWVGTVVNGSPAASAGFTPGDKIVSIDGQPVNNWQQVQMRLADMLDGREKPLPVSVIADGRPVVRSIDAQRFQAQFAQAFESGHVGLLSERYLPVVGALQPEGVAAEAGLKVGDRILAVDGNPLADWQAFINIVRDSPGKLLTLTIARQNKQLSIALRPALLETGDTFIGHVGLGPQPDMTWMKALQYTRQRDIAQAGVQAVHKTVTTSWMSVLFVGRMLTGTASVDNLGGPLAIANVAGLTARQGLITYLEFLALISISIGVLNLLPIPVLDGGQLMYYTAELIRGRPLSERIQMMGQRIGFALLFALMAFAMLNDISRLFGG